MVRVFVIQYAYVLYVSELTLTYKTDYKYVNRHRRLSLNLYCFYYQLI